MVRRFLKVGFFKIGLAALIGTSPAAKGAEVEVGQVVVTATRTEVEISDSPPVDQRDNEGRNYE